MHHIEENIINQLAFAKDSFSEDERMEILSHIESCELCKEIYVSYQILIKEINDEFNSEPTENDKELGKKIASTYIEEKKKQLSENKPYVQVYEGNFEIVNAREKSFLPNLLRNGGIPQKIINYIKYNPVKSASFLAFLGIMCVVLVMYPAKTSIDTNPYFAKVENLKLKIYNKDSELLWEKTSYGLPETSSDSLMNWIPASKKCIDVEDIDGDNVREVLISGRIFDTDIGFYSADSVYCYNSNGNLRWVSSGEDLDNPQAPQWRNTGRFIRDFFTTKSGKQIKLFIVGHDRAYAGAFISEINPKNGKVIGTLYHSGWFSDRVNIDLENDGIEEIVLSGTSSFDKPAILVLKTDNIYGVMPDLFSKGKNYEKGTAYAYILLYTRDLNKLNNDFALEIYPELRKMGRDGFYLITSETKHSNNEFGGIMYAFNGDLKINNISSSWIYSEKYNRLYEDGLVKEKLDSTYFKMLQDSIQYWNGEKFVNYPSRNKYYSPREGRENLP